MNLCRTCNAFSLIGLSMLALNACAGTEPASGSAVGRTTDLITTIAAPTIALPELSAAERARWLDADGEGPLLIGFGRALPERAVNSALARQGQWRAQPDGRRRLGIRVKAPGAVGLRLGVRVAGLPDSARLTFTGSSRSGLPGAVGTHERPGAAINASARANRDSGARGEAAGLDWSPLVAGDELELAIEIPAGFDPDEVRISLPRIAHFVRWPADADPPSGDPTACHESMDHAWDRSRRWETPSLATAILLHTRDDGGSITCTGTLLADADPATAIPYLITARHCVPDQVRAASLETYWRHGGRRSRERVVSVSGGADLLYSAPATDTSLVRLRSAPPAGAAFARWSARPPPLYTAVTGLHQPFGRPRKRAEGFIVEAMHCAALETCDERTDPHDTHFWRVEWSAGPTGPGSSGSGLFLDSGELVGTLHGGFSRCDNPEGPDDYGRFDRPYHDALHRWLGPPGARP